MTRPPAWTLSALLVLGAALFVLGSAIERGSDHHVEAAPGAVVSTTGAVAESDTPTTVHAEGGSEGSESGAESGAATTIHVESGAEASGETGAGSAAHAEGAAALAAEGSNGETHTKVLGIDTESTAIVASAAVISVLLAVLVWRRRNVALLAAAIVFALLFAVFDVVEVFHQVDVSRGGLAVLAGVIATVHFTAAAVGAAARRVVL